MMNGFGDVCSSSGSMMTIAVTKAKEEDEDDAAAISSEDSSCPETELDLALGLSIGLNNRRNHSKIRSSLSSSSSSLTRESGTKRSADSSAATASKGQVAVGWPPLRTYRINSLINQAKSLATESSDIHKDTTRKGVVVVAAKNDDDDDECFVKSNRSSMLVKVTMDGVIIGRKVDLNALDSYVALAKTLEQMFFQIPSSLTRSDTQGCKTIKEPHVSELLDGYIITYQDKDGDWMLVGDVPWQMFLGSVKRLRIMRTSSDTRVGK